MTRMGVTPMPGTGMNRTSYALMSIVLLCGCAGQAIHTDTAAEPWHVYFLGGQSNMDGYGFVNELPAELNRTIDGAMIFTGNVANDNDTSGGVGIWEPLQPGHGTGFTSDGEANAHSDRFGPELAFGATLRTLQPESRLAIIKYSRGGSGLALDIGFGSWEPDFAGGNGINQYDNALTTITKCVLRCFNHCLFSDTKNTRFYTAFERKFTSVLRTFQTDCEEKKGLLFFKHLFL